MLYKIIFIYILIFTQNLFAKDISPEFKNCITKALLTSNHTEQSLEAKRIAQGETAINKEFRSLMAEAKYGGELKHATKTKDGRIAKTMTEGRGGAAQYIPGIDEEKIERYALQYKDGFYRSFKDKNGGKKSTFYKYVKFDKTIGYEGGEETEWIRVEWSSGTFHGHPIGAARLKEQCPECL